MPVSIVIVGMSSSLKGVFHDGLAFSSLCQYYAKSILASNVEFDVLFGPAYKGIPLAAGVAIILQMHHNRNVQFCYSRKEVKDHGEGGNVVGASLEVIPFKYSLAFIILSIPRGNGFY